MIFLTVGTQLPFERLVKAMDSWCADNPQETVFGQIASVGGDGYKPCNFEWKEFVEPDEFARKYEEADVIVAHAGMGSIISALTDAKKILVMPRRADLNEHRNDHQLATAARFQSRAGIYVIMDETNLAPSLTGLLTEAMPVNAASQFAEASLVAAIRDFIHDKPQ